MKKLFPFSVVVISLGSSVLVAAPFPEDAPWGPSTGPPGGVVSALARLDSSLFAGTKAGLYKSTDGGASWRPTDLPLKASVIALGVIDDVILAGTQTDGIFRSTDGGEHWLAANEGLPPASNAIAFAVSDRGLFSIVNGSLVVSVDMGQSWIPRGFLPAPITSLVAVGGTLYSGASPISPDIATGGVYRSDDSGKTWVSTSPLLSQVSANSVYYSDGFLFAATQSDGVLRSSDQGAHWESSLTLIRSVHVITRGGGFLYAGADNGVFRSQNEGETWVPTSHPQTAVLCLTPFGSDVFSGSLLGVYESRDDGNSWMIDNSGLTNTYVAGIWTADSDVFSLVSEPTPEPGIFQTTLYRSSDSGKSWAASGEGLPLGSYVNSIVSDGNEIFAGVTGVGVYRSVDHGVHWSPSGLGLPVVVGELYLLAASSDLLLVGIGNEIFHSVDAGATWTGPGAGLSADELISSIVIDGNVAYASTTSRVVRSVDGGVSWQATGLAQFTRIVGVSIGSVYAVTSASGVWKSINGGDSWNPTALTRNDIYSFAASGGWLFASNFGNALGAGQESHVFVSSDNGDSWETADQNLFLSGELGGVYLAASDTDLYAGTQGYGVQKLVLQPDRESIEAPARSHSPRVVGRQRAFESR